MNKKLLLICGLSIIIVMLLIMISRKYPLPVLKMTEDEMPNFKFHLIDGGFIQTSDIDDEKFTMIWFFNSECDICVNEIQSLVDSISLLNDCRIVLVSYEDSIKVADFHKLSRLIGFPSVQVAYMPYDSLINMFKIYVTPTLYVYNSDKRMIKYKPGPVTIHEIVQYLK